MYVNRGKEHETVTQTQGYTDTGVITNTVLPLLILYLLRHYVCKGQDLTDLASFAMKAYFFLNRSRKKFTLFH